MGIVKLKLYSYRFAEEIIQHKRHRAAWAEIELAVKSVPLFVYPNKSEKNKSLDVVQQLLNTYFDRKMVLELGWDYHPLATKIPNSNLRADYRKAFGDLTIQAEFQFGNMGRWYSDIFKFQTAYSQGLIKMGLSVVPMYSIGKRIDSNVAHFERTKRELQAAEVSITIPILLIGLEPDRKTPVIDVSKAQFGKVSQINGKGRSENRWRIVNGIRDGVPIAKIGPKSSPGRTLAEDTADTEDDAAAPPA